jgi:hypothetical protein
LGYTPPKTIGDVCNSDIGTSKDNTKYICFYGIIIVTAAVTAYTRTLTVRWRKHLNGGGSGLISYSFKFARYRRQRSLLYPAIFKG